MTLARIIDKAHAGRYALPAGELTALLDARDPGECHALYEAAADVKRSLWGERVTYVVNLNLNFTNVCVQRCGFCNFRRDARDADAYRMTLSECVEHVRRHTPIGITEVTIQGGLDDETPVEFYFDLVRTLKCEFPDIHLHAFSPEEIFYLHERTGETPRRIIERLRDSGLGSMPGTAAEILVDDVRRKLCAQKVTTDEWCAVVEAAHESGIPTTSTMMYGHIETTADRAAHLLRLLAVQRRTGGFTEFVGLPFVAANAPVAIKRGLRSPATREALNVTAAARLLFRSELPHVQAVAWVKRGMDEAVASLHCGADDLGGTLVEERITRAAGANHGSYVPAPELRRRIEAEGFRAVERTTLYHVNEETAEASARDESELRSMRAGA